MQGYLVRPLPASTVDISPKTELNAFSAAKKKRTHSKFSNSFSAKAWVQSVLEGVALLVSIMNSDGFDPRRNCEALL